MRYANGYLEVVRWRGAPVRLHWSVPLGALFFGRFTFAPVVWVLFPLLVLVHEFGHAYMVGRAGCRVLAIDAHAMGGQCAWRGAPTPLARAGIAWGGVLAQGLLLLVTLAGVAIFELPYSEWASQAYRILVWTNVSMIVLNLLPIPPLDGAEAWRIVPMLPEALRGLFRRGKRRGGEVARDGKQQARRVSAKVVELGARKSKAEADADAQHFMEQIRAEAETRRKARGDGGSLEN